MVVSWSQWEKGLCSIQLDPQSWIHLSLFCFPLILAAFISFCWRVLVSTKRASAPETLALPHCLTVAPVGHKSCSLRLGCQPWCSLESLEFEMDPGAYKWFSDREKRSKSWGQPLEMRDFQSEDQYPIYARSCAIALEEVDVGCAILSGVAPCSMINWPETDLDEFSGSPFRLRLYICQEVCQHCTKSGVLKPQCLAHIRTHTPYF